MGGANVFWRGDAMQNPAAHPIGSSEVELVVRGAYNILVFANRIDARSFASAERETSVRQLAGP